MWTGFHDYQQLSKESVERTLAAIGAVSKGVSALTVEMTEASRKAFTANASYLERLAGARTLDKAVEVQTDYARTAYETLVSETSRVNGLVVDMAKEAAKPFTIIKTV